MMNALERRMVSILRELKEKHGAICVRAEFEAEGTKLEELLRLKEISMAAGLGLMLKIGGCESIRDMLEARVVGVNYLVAPMVESGYALQKYLLGVQKVLPPEERNSVEILCNIETMTAVNRFDEMLAVPERAVLRGVVVERVDLCFSLGLSEEDINDRTVNAIVMELVRKAKGNGLVTIVGGGVSAHSLPFFGCIGQGCLDRFETRKICFDYSGALRNNPEKGILKALGFELLWLRNKGAFYRKISLADEERMNLIEGRYWQEIDALI
jgi:4-hydroxy-2-oxoheptanedioate aldolase